MSKWKSDRVQVYNVCGGGGVQGGSRNARMQKVFPCTFAQGSIVRDCYSSKVPLKRLVFRCKRLVFPFKRPLQNAMPLKGLVFHFERLVFPLKRLVFLFKKVRYFLSKACIPFTKACVPLQKAYVSFEEGLCFLWKSLCIV